MAQSGLTYYINPVTGRLTTMIDGKDSVVQAIFKALDTERFVYNIYGWTYGLDMERFVTAELDYIQANIPQYLEDCLLQDDRIISVDNIKVAQQDIDSCLITFDVNTTEGLIQNVTKEITHG